ncbi:MAG: glycosyltransferase family 2 protein [Pseudomonadales bacterium]
MNSDISPASICAIVVNYNGGDYLKACLDSLERQTLAPTRVIVVDNASNDGSAELAAQHSLGVEMIQNIENLGFAAANNQAIEQAQDSEWLALLNPDAEADPEWIESLHAVASKQPSYDSFASLQVAARDSNICDGAGDCYHAVGYGWRRGHNLPLDQNMSDHQEVFSSCAAACLLRRSAVEAVGGFDTQFFCYGEDLDLGFRMRLNGGKALFVKRARVVHHQSAITGERSEFSVYHGQRNLVWVFIKNMPTTLFILMLVPHIILNLGAIVAYSARGQFRTVFRAKLDALRGLKVIWSKRQTIQRRASKVSKTELSQAIDFGVAQLWKRLATS